jgi:hypothetical protein
MDFVIHFYGNRCLSCLLDYPDIKRPETCKQFCERVIFFHCSKKIPIAIQRFDLLYGHNHMKLFLTLIIFTLMLPLVAKPFAPLSIMTPQTNESLKKSASKYNFKQSKAILECTLGRKLKFKEKIALRLQPALLSAKGINEGKANTHAVLGFVFAVAGIIILWPLLIPAFILSKNALIREKENPGVLTPTNLTLAKIGKIASLVGLIILAIAAIIIAIVIANGGFGAL